jgi:hypothetical protein
MWHAGGELTFTVKHLVAPGGSTLDVETNGATADADKNSEKSGNEVGQYLLFGLAGVFTHRGNDILGNKMQYESAPLDWDLVTVKSKMQLDQASPK